MQNQSDFDNKTEMLNIFVKILIRKVKVLCNRGDLFQSIHHKLLRTKKDVKYVIIKPYSIFVVVWHFYFLVVCLFVIEMVKSLHFPLFFSLFLLILFRSY